MDTITKHSSYIFYWAIFQQNWQWQHIERWKQNLDGKILLGVLSTDMSKKIDLLHSPLLIAKLRAYGHSYGMYSKMICIKWWKNVHYSRTPTTINCHMLLRRLKRLSQFWTKKRTKFPSGMTKIFWKVTSPNIKTKAFGSKQKNKKVKILRTEVACEQALLGLPGVRGSGREEANESLHSRLVSLNIYVPEQDGKCWWAPFLSGDEVMFPRES